MKKLLSVLAVFGMLSFGAFATEDSTATEEQAAVSQETAAPAEAAPAAETAETAKPEVKEVGLHQALKQKFIEGGAGFMGVVVLCLILGLALAIERIIYLNMATTNTEKLVERIESALQEGGVEAAMDVCRDTRGPVASIFYQGLSRLKKVSKW